MLAEPWNRGELDRVRGLVDCGPPQEQVRRLTELFVGGGEIGADEEQPRWAVGVSECDVILAEDLPGAVADSQPRLRSCRRSGDRPRDAADRPRCRHSGRDPGFERPRELTERS